MKWMTSQLIKKYGIKTRKDHLNALRKLFFFLPVFASTLSVFATPKGLPKYNISVDNPRSIHVNIFIGFKVAINAIRGAPIFFTLSNGTNGKINLIAKEATLDAILNFN